jgi:glycosyltransferase involved in cell wall biosynthesis
MRIALNADLLSAPSTGIGRYLSQLIESLGQVDGVNEYIMLSHLSIPSHLPTPSSFSWEEIPVSGPSEQIRRVRWEQRTFPEIARKRNAKMLFVPFFGAPAMANLPSIITVHDLLPFSVLEYRPNSAIWLYHQILVQGIKKATYIIAVSEFIKSELIRLFAIPPERIVVSNGAPPATFRPVTDIIRLRELRAKYNLGEQFLVYNGGFDARKNVPLLIGAFAAAMHRLSDNSTKLIIIGSSNLLGSSALYPDWRPLVRKFGLENRVLNLTVPDDELPTIYSAATAFVYPSGYEGFGWYPLAAMACGVTVIISDHPALQETAGSAGIFFDGTHHESRSVDPMRSLISQITRVLTNDELREEYHQRSLARARMFSWSQTAADMSGIFSEVGGMRH